MIIFFLNILSPFFLQFFSFFFFQTNITNAYWYLRLSPSHICTFTWLIGSDLRKIHNVWSISIIHLNWSFIRRLQRATQCILRYSIESPICLALYPGLAGGLRRDGGKGRTIGVERTRWREESKGGPCVSKGFRVFRITSCSAPELVCRDPRVTPLYWHIVERDPNTCDIIPNCEQSCRRGDLLVKSPVNRKQIVRVRQVPRILG